MPFYQNNFMSEFSDRLPNGTAVSVCPSNGGRGDAYIVGYGEGPYDLSGNDSDGVGNNALYIKFSPSNGEAIRNWIVIGVSVTTGAATSSAVTAEEVVASLGSDPNFSSFFIAEVQPAENNTKAHVRIRQKKATNGFRFFVLNKGAETKLRFNKFSGVKALHSYFSRHNVGNTLFYADSNEMLVELNPGASSVDASVINNAVNMKGQSLGYDSTQIPKNWQLMLGDSKVHKTKLQSVDGSDRIVECIEFNTGARVGDSAIKTSYCYTNANKTPSRIVTELYTLTQAEIEDADPTTPC